MEALVVIGIIGVIAIITIPSMRRARMRVISKPCPVTEARVRAERRICPPPSPRSPSMEIRATPYASDRSPTELKHRRHRAS